jgi:alpha-beta hydrolase superfamily lysophospholipase
MIDRFAQFPKALATRSENRRLGPAGTPTLLAHPDWERPSPVVFWMHGRTVNKELDPGRYLRWVRAGIAACAVDLPGHGERLDPAFQGPSRSLEMLDQMRREIDGVLQALDAPEFHGLFDLNRVGIGGMSAGGMVTLRRLCEPHQFVCASVEGTTGSLGALYHPQDAQTRTRAPWAVSHDPGAVAAADPSVHLASWKPIPLLALHSEADAIVPWEGQRRFLESLRAHYARLGADPQWVQSLTWPTTGAPQEHAGFGRFANDAKNAQVDFFREHLLASAPQGVEEGTA